MNESIQIVKVSSRRQLKKVVSFPWKIYKDDPYWVPPLISSQIKRLTPETSRFFKLGEAEVFYAMRQGAMVGTIVPWMNHRMNEYLNEKGAGFGFFETINDPDVAGALLNAACNWAKERGAGYIRGPLYFSPEDSPGVLVKGFDHIPAPMVGHTPEYYPSLLEQFGFRKYRDAFAYAVSLEAFNGSLENIPKNLLQLAMAAEKRYNIVVRNIRMEHWNKELQAALYIINSALGYQREGVPMDDQEFIKMANDLKHIIDPKLIFVAEVKDEPVGLFIAMPNINEVLQKMNGRLFPFGWYYFLRRHRYIHTVSTKILGVLKDYRRRGVDALLYKYIADELMRRGHSWLDFSLVAEENVMANRLVTRFGGTVYQVCRTYHLNL